MSKYAGLIGMLLIFVTACEGFLITGDIFTAAVRDQSLITAVDISRYPEIALDNPTFYDLENRPGEFLNILRKNGINYIRLRLWVNPENGHSGLDEVKAFARQIRAEGFGLWLALHYSDTWADPGRQRKPLSWQGTGFAALQDSVGAYTARVVKEIQPELIQIGNEINTGFLHPEGSIAASPGQLLSLLKTAVAAVRGNAPRTGVIIHYAGIEGAEWFFDQMNTLDYDIIGISYYPIWHGRSLEDLSAGLNKLGAKYGKDILIAETAYPFTLDWNDQTHNIVGLDEHLILPRFPASPQGQHDFILAINAMVAQEVSRGIGWCYWGAELISWKGRLATDGSPWENQALFDFENRALPVLEGFR